jgi:hypothetical protein
MKTCPTCGTTYSRRVTFCFDDGAPLVGAPEPEVAPPAPKVIAPPVPLPRRGRSLLARRRGTQPVTQEHTDFGDDGYRPKALEPMPVVSRRTAPPRPRDSDRTPPSADGRGHAAAGQQSNSTPTAPVSVAQPPVIPHQPPVIPHQPTIVPPEDSAPIRASEAQTIIREPDEDDDVGVWGLWFTVLVGVGGVVLAGLAIAGGLFYMNGESGIATRPEPAPIAVVPPAAVAAPQPVASPEPAVIEADSEAQLDTPDADTSEPVAPEPPIAAEPSPQPTPQAEVVLTPSPRPRPLPDIRVEPIPAPVPVAPGPSSPWTEVAPEPQAPVGVASAPLSVTSTPTGAAVFVNGVNLGATPFRMTMPGGSYPIELRLEGYEAVSSRVVISDSSGAALDLSLSALARSGPVTVMTAPDWIGAELMVDGRNSGTIPASIPSLEEGTHTFLLRKGGIEQAFTRTVSLNASGMTVLNLGG